MACGFYELGESFKHGGEEKEEYNTRSSPF